MPLIVIKILGWFLTAGSLLAAAWWVYDKIGDGAVAAYQAQQLFAAMEIDNREDQKVDKVLKENREELDKLRRANDVLARTLSIKFKDDPCWNHPLPPDFIRMYENRDSQGVPTFTFNISPQNPTSSDD
jgi:hypothetical protein